MGTAGRGGGGPDKEKNRRLHRNEATENKTISSTATKSKTPPTRVVRQSRSNLYVKPILYVSFSKKYRDKINVIEGRPFSHCGEGGLEGDDTACGRVSKTSNSPHFFCRTRHRRSWKTCKKNTTRSLSPIRKWDEVPRLHVDGGEEPNQLGVFPLREVQEPEPRECHFSLLPRSLLGNRPIPHCLARASVDVLERSNSGRAKAGTGRGLVT